MARNFREDDKSWKEVAVNVADEQSGHSTTVDIPSQITTIRRPGMLHRVPPQLRANKEHLYAPAVFPLGPIHHDEVRFDQAEQLKNEVLNIKLDENGKAFAHGEFLKRAQEIRNFYGGLRGYTYDDETLAEMMLRDACFFLYYMESRAYDKQAKQLITHNILSCLGLSGYIFMSLDFSMLENQLPLWAIKLLIRLSLFQGDKDDKRVEEFIWKFISKISSTGRELSDPSAVGVEGVHPWGDGKEQEPLHLLELYRTTRIKPRISSGTDGSRNGVFCKIFQNLKWKSCWDRKTGRSSIGNHPARSVMDLKAKGIQVRPSSTCLTDIRFKSYWFFGKLLLPTYFINSNRKVLFSNLIAFEMSPKTETKFEFISYVNFMQSLIESPKDVKELREKGVLSSSMNDEQVMNTFKELDIYGMDNLIFNDVKLKIDWHCRSKAKTWMAELFHTYFRNPWSAIALFSAAILLCLTFLQTIYAKKSAK